MELLLPVAAGDSSASGSMAGGGDGLLDPCATAPMINTHDQACRHFFNANEHTLRTLSGSVVMLSMITVVTFIIFEGSKYPLMKWALSLKVWPQVYPIQKAMLINFGCELAH
eukprot:SAG31_NODE_2239_length_6115_cov_2.178191_2_plen_112_part_00